MFFEVFLLSKVSFESKYGICCFVHAWPFRFISFFTSKYTLINLLTAISLYTLGFLSTALWLILREEKMNWSRNVLKNYLIFILSFSPQSKCMFIQTSVNFVLDFCESLYATKFFCLNLRVCSYQQMVIFINYWSRLILQWLITIY